MQSNSSVDLTNCDREPIHVPGSIQAHGCLIATDAAMMRIHRHSANTSEFLGLATGDINGKLLEDILPRDVAHEFRNALSRASGANRPAVLLDQDVTGNGRLYDVALHIHHGSCIMEFEGGGRRESTSPMDIARAGISRIDPATTVAQLGERTARLLRALLGYDRVMIYRFAEDGSGSVLHEAKRGDLESFLGQHFPASDIPQQARRLYVENTLRVIGDVAGQNVQLVPVLNEAVEPLDLSRAHLRSVSPIHIEYLRNMGVAASMSISIIVGRQLWGLIACHHYAPRRLTMAERIGAELFGDVYSLKVETLLRRQAHEDASTMRRMLDELLSDIAAHDNIAALLEDRIQDFGRLIPSDGIGLFVNGIWTAHGHVPSKASISTLAKFIGEVAEGRVWATNELSRAFPEAAEYVGEASGVLAIPLSQIPRDFLFYFRREQIQTINWAGDPNKTYGTGALGARLTPRRSFAVWKETVERQSTPWSTVDRGTADAIRIQLLEVILRQNEMLASERRKAEVRQKMLHEELNHRVKNILAVIKSIVSQPIEDDRSIVDYVSNLKGRILALSFAHDQIIRYDGGGPLRDLVDAELSPYRDTGSTIRVSGRPVQLGARALSVLALVLHEMSTNAAKYGALSQASGHLKVSWQETDKGDCEIIWEETGGPPVNKPERRGFGSILLERSIPFDLGGTSDVEYRAAGLWARLVIPAEFVKFTSEPTKEPAARSTATDISAIMAKRVLLVEDQLVIALEAEQMLAELGAGEISTAGSATEALHILASAAIDVAVLDINLGSSSSIPVAEELKRRAIPFVFATGYGDTMMIPPSMARTRVVRKPYTASTLNETIAQALRDMDLL
jgi:light-regulated signal transduction histidine kinase (bacteriophytochrome)